MKEVILIALFISLASGQNITFCQEPYQTTLCGNTHVGCINNFRSQCPSGSSRLDMSLYRDYIVDKHNEFRNQIASGTLRNRQGTSFSPANKMTTVKWDPNLAYLAQATVNDCVFAHSACRKTPTYKWAGENLAWTSGYGERAAVEYAITAWWNEYLDANQNVIDNFQSSHLNVGHFTVMANEISDQVGCGGIAYGGGQIMIACQYSWTNVLNYPVYRKGATASSCTRRPVARYPNLCAADEPLKYDF